MKNFKDTKDYILEKAAEMDACSDEFTRAEQATTKKELLVVIRDNLHWVTTNGLFDGLSILEYFSAKDLLESGVGNVGKNNTGLANTGDSNTGDRNTGDRNTGDRNTGYRNTGDWNTGDRNTGYWNTGDWNTGDWNTGYSNTGDRNTGVFCTEKNPQIWMFDNPTTLTMQDFRNLEVFSLMRKGLSPNIWVDESFMTEAEKEKNTQYSTTGGYLKCIPMKEAWSNFWNNLQDSKKRLFMELPNFDREKFKDITGIDVNGTEL